MNAASRSSLIDRAVRAARLEDTVYEVVEHDREATAQAAIIVVVTSIAAGIGAIPIAGVGGLIAFTISGVLGWLAYAYVTYLIGTRVLAGPETQSDFGELARTLGFASAPRIFLIFVGIPVLGFVVSVLVFFWVLVTTVFAVRAALDMSTQRAIVTAIVSVLVLVVIQTAIALIL